MFQGPAGVRRAWHALAANLLWALKSRSNLIMQSVNGSLNAVPFADMPSRDACARPIFAADTLDRASFLSAEPRAAAAWRAVQTDSAAAGVLIIAALGISTTAGCGSKSTPGRVNKVRRCSLACSWATQMGGEMERAGTLESAMTAEPRRATVHGQGKPGALLEYFVQCTSPRLLPPGVHVVLLEILAAIDPSSGTRTQPLRELLEQLRHAAPRAAIVLVDWPSTRELGRSMEERVMALSHTFGADVFSTMAVARELFASETNATARSASVDSAPTWSKWMVSHLFETFGSQPNHPNSHGHSLLAQGAARLVLRRLRDTQLPGGVSTSNATSAEAAEWCSASVEALPVTRACGFHIHDDGLPGVPKLGYVSSYVSKRDDPAHDHANAPAKARVAPEVAPDRTPDEGSRRTASSSHRSSVTPPCTPEDHELVLGPIFPQMACGVLMATVGYLAAWRVVEDQSPGDLHITCEGCTCVPHPGTLAKHVYPFPTVHTLSRASNVTVTAFTKFVVAKRLSSECFIRIRHAYDPLRGRTRVRVDSLSTRQVDCAIMQWLQVRRALPRTSLASLGRPDCTRPWTPREVGDGPGDGAPQQVRGCFSKGAAASPGGQRL